MPSLNTQFEMELKKLIDEESARLTNILAAGKLADFSDYRYHVGQIRALERIADDYFPEVNKKIAGT
jgi:hypothetical protein